MPVRKFLSILFFVCSLLTNYQLTGQSVLPENPSFVHITKEQGLLQNHILAVCKDSQGFMWFGTYGGLHRFDGFDFDYYVQNDTVPGSLSYNTVHAIYEDTQSRLWVGTDKGLNLLIPEKNNFKVFLKDHLDEKGIRAIVEDAKGMLWLATYGGGVVVFDPVKGKIHKVFSEATQNLPGNFVNTIFKDRQGNIWAGLESQGLYLFETANGKFVRKAEGLADQTITSIVEDKQGNLWIGTWRGGLGKFDPVSGKVINFLPDKHVDSSIPDFTVRQIVFGPEGKLWLATTNGLGIFNTETGECRTLRKDKDKLQSLSLNFLWSLEFGNDKVLWIGTFGGGICKLDPGRNQFEVLGTNSSCGPEDDFISLVSVDSKERLWVAGNNSGVDIYKKNNTCLFQEKVWSLFPERKIKCLYEDRSNYFWLGCEDGIIRITPDFKQSVFVPLSSGLLGFSVYSITEDKNGNLWLGGYNTGILKLPARSKHVKKIDQESFTQFSSGKGGNFNIPSDIIWTILSDREGKLWVGAEQNLLLFEETKQKFNIYSSELSSVFDISEMPDGTIWLGTTGSGLISLNQKGILKKYMPPVKAGQTTIQSLKVHNGIIWLGTDDGIFRFDPSEESFISYYTADGIPLASFVKSSCEKTGDGSLLFGTTNGLIRFYPDKIQSKADEPVVRINDVLLFNKSISLEHSDHPLLDNNLEQIQKLELDHDQNFITLKFSAIQHSVPVKTRFTYKVDGLQGKWMEADEDRKVSFTALNPGEYIFRLRTLDRQGKPGNKEVSLSISILPPWYQTLWFKTLLAFSMICSVFGFFFLRTRQIRIRNQMLQDQVNEKTRDLTAINLTLSEQNEEIKNKTEKILDQQKELLSKKYELEKKNEKLQGYNQFQKKLIAVLGHDLRGPLNHFSLLLDYEDEESSVFVKSRLKETANSIKNLATDLLGWVTVQSREEEIVPASFKWDEVLNKVLQELEPLRADKEIKFNIQQEKELSVCGTMAIVQTSLRNVLSNAIRFSEPGGVIEITYGIKESEHSILKVTDFGRGFDAEHVNSLINGAAFEGKKDPIVKDHAGLGLAICNDMLHRIGGKLEAISLPGSGATFLISLPVSDMEPVERVEKVDVFKPETAIKLDQPKSEYLKGKKILLVDDDDELRWVLMQVLSDYAEIHELRSGEEAMEWLKENSLDLAIMDLNMPGMSGFDLCRKIKAAKDTAHVPCMVISGETEQGIRSKVFEAGAEAFLVKPFEPQDLLLQIISYFENHDRKLKKFFLENESVNELTDNPLNQEFMEKLIEIFENNLTSGDLNVDFIAREMGLSRSSLYRSLKSITGQNVNDFIKSIRMRKALQLLREGQLNISEIAFETGFNSRSYFTTSFKKHFGYSPTELKK